jgi:hypothetical protein
VSPQLLDCRAGATPSRRGSTFFPDGNSTAAAGRALLCPTASLIVEPSVFRDRSRMPTEDELEAALGPSIALWRSLRVKIGGAFAPVDERWSFSGKAHGWSLRLAHRDRGIVFLAPLVGRFRASLALPERAMTAAGQADLPEAVRDTIATAPIYPEGRAVRIEVTTQEDVASVIALARIRMAS